ncbi:protein disulfide-isomerase A1 [Nematocida homosporus]|uniref:protein disulfide-isomerase A1 n=1 Tax=Nematocida homosporus TaxID=1912981 RepID=UPI00221EC490|nr:protein disulfide-isomerase A1 [Nematocida homosporus]KAI5187209.1 protein disulfide-isomerase A1 [Nematocida homosporus]
MRFQWIFGILMLSLVHKIACRAKIEASQTKIEATETYTDSQKETVKVETVIPEESPETVVTTEELEPETTQNEIPTENSAILFSSISLSQEEIDKIKESMTVQFTFSPDQDLANTLATPFPGFYYHSDKGLYTYPVTGENAEAIQKELLQYQNIASIPYFDEIKQENYQNYENTGLVTTYVISESAKKQELSWMEQPAEHFKTQMKIALLDFESTRMFLESAGLREEMKPALFVIVTKVEGSSNTPKIYKYLKTNISQPEEVHEFINGYLGNALTPFLMDEKVEEGVSMVSESGVTRITNSTFSSFAMDKLKNVLVVYHVEWCKYCQILLPELEELAAALQAANVTDIAVGKMLMTKNDIPLDLDVQGIEAYPTVRLYKTGTNDEIIYEPQPGKPINAEAIIAFLKKHTDLPEDFTIAKPLPTEERVPEEVPEIKTDL